MDRLGRRLSLFILNLVHLFDFFFPKEFAAVTREHISQGTG